MTDKHCTSWDKVRELEKVLAAEIHKAIERAFQQMEPEREEELLELIGDGHVRLPFVMKCIKKSVKEVVPILTVPPPPLTDEEIECLKQDGWKYDKEHGWAWKDEPGVSTSMSDISTIRVYVNGLREKKDESTEPKEGNE